MVKTILISNPVAYHYEILEEIILQARTIVKDNSTVMFDIYLSIVKNPSFEKYIFEKYPFLNLATTPSMQYDYIIHATVYPKHEHHLLSKIKITRNSKKEFFILHETQPKFQNYKNVYSLTPFLPKNQLQISHLPFSNYTTVQTDIPIFAVQGNLKKERRDWSQLVTILSQPPTFPFLLKLIGRGDLPNELKPFEDMIILKNNLDFIDYHYEFLDVYCLLTLNSPEKTPQYFQNKFTSNIAYLKTYGLRGIMHRKLYQLYPHLKNISTFENDHELLSSFQKTLYEFYR